MAPTMIGIKGQKDVLIAIKKDTINTNVLNYEIQKEKIAFIPLQGKITKEKEVNQIKKMDREIKDHLVGVQQKSELRRKGKILLVRQTPQLNIRIPVQNISQVLIPGPLVNHIQILHKAIGKIKNREYNPKRKISIIAPNKEKVSITNKDKNSKREMNTIHLLLALLPKKEKIAPKEEIISIKEDLQNQTSIIIILSVMGSEGHIEEILIGTATIEILINTQIIVKTIGRLINKEKINKREEHKTLGELQVAQEVNLPRKEELSTHLLNQNERQQTSKMIILEIFE